MGRRYTHHSTRTRAGYPLFLFALIFYSCIFIASVAVLFLFMILHSHSAGPFYVHSMIYPLGGLRVLHYTGWWSLTAIKQVDICHFWRLCFLYLILSSYRELHSRVVRLAYLGGDIPTCLSTLVLCTGRHLFDGGRRRHVRDSRHLGCRSNVWSTCCRMKVGRGLVGCALSLRPWRSSRGISDLLCGLESLRTGDTGGVWTRRVTSYTRD